MSSAAQSTQRPYTSAPRDAYRDFELEHERSLGRTARIAQRADDLDAELRRMRAEAARVACAFVGSFASRSRLSQSVDEKNTRHDGNDAAAGIVSSSKSVVSLADSEEDSGNRIAEPYVGVGAMQELNLVPKRNIGWSSWSALSNAAVALRLGGASLIAFPVRAVRAAPAGALSKGQSFVRGFGRGVASCAAFLAVGGVMSPLIHVIAGSYNTTLGWRNTFTCDRTFDVYNGVYSPSSTLYDQQHFAELHALEQRLLVRAHRDHRRKKAAADQFGQSFPLFQLMKDRLGSIGGLGPKNGKAGTGGSASKFDAESDNYYRVLQVAPNATEKEIKQSYGRLAKVFHPDMDPSPQARVQFDRITKAYQTLLNPQLRKAYDAGGAQFADATRQSSGFDGNGVDGSPLSAAAGSASSAASASVIMHGTPMEVMQRIFGGVGFEQLLIGPVYRSIFHMRAQGSVRVNLHTYEVIETLRMLRLATFLAAVLDTYAMSDELLGLVVYRELLTRCDANASKTAAAVERLRPHVFALLPKNVRNDFDIDGRGLSGSGGGGGVASASEFPPLEPFTKRAVAFAQRLSKCCFGREMLHEVGQSYTVNAQRYLGETAIWKPRMTASLKAAAGLGRMKRSFTGSVDTSDPTKIVTHDDLANFFSIEFDNVVCNLHMVVRFVCITAARDASVPQLVRAALFSRAGAGGGETGGAASVIARGDPDGSQAVCPRTLDAGTRNRDKRVLLVKPRQPATSPQMREILTTLRDVVTTDADRAAFVNKIAVAVLRARCVALKELGRVFMETGEPWRDKPLAQCVAHIRQHGTSAANASMPPPF